MCGCGRRSAERCHHFPERGWIQFLFLRLLYEKPSHGYQLMEELQRRGFVQPGRLESGSVYTILRRMESRGLLESTWDENISGPDRRVYRVTEAGARFLKAGIEALMARKAVMDDLINFYRRNFEKEL